MFTRFYNINRDVHTFFSNIFVLLHLTRCCHFLIFKSRRFPILFIIHAKTGADLYYARCWSILFAHLPTLENLWTSSVHETCVLLVFFGTSKGVKKRRGPSWPYTWHYQLQPFSHSLRHNRLWLTNSALFTLCKTGPWWGTLRWRH